MNYYFKWFLVVSLNSISGFCYATDDDVEFVLGMVSGVLTWYLIYISLDRYLLKTGHINISRKLFLSAAIRAPLQLLVFPDILAGLAAVATIEYLGVSLSSNGFLSSYSATLFTGLYLSVFCSFVYMIITCVERRGNA